MKISKAFKERTRATDTINNKPTMTDQSQAADTDTNKIIGKFLKTGQIPPGPGNIRYGDFTALPSDLRGFLEMARSIDANRQTLPPELREIPVEELVTLSNYDIQAILNPAKKDSVEQPKTETPKTEEKK